MRIPKPADLLRMGRLPEAWIAPREVREFLVRYFRTRTLSPFAVCCIIAGLGSISYLKLIK